MFWNPPRYLKGATVAILGGGPSLSGELVKRVRRAGVRVIGVNDAYRFGNDVDICYWGDGHWFHGNDTHPGHREQLEKWHGLKVTDSPDCVQFPGVFGLSRREDPGLWPPPCCRWYRNSGLSAIGLAVTLGAERILLLGFDGQAVDGVTHWHPDCVERPNDRVFMEHRNSAVELMKDIAAYPGGRSVAVWNCTPNSMYGAFNYADLEEVLNFGGLE